MISFFSAIKGKFSAEFDGRFLALILQEIGNRHPRPLISFISNVFGLPIRDLRNPRFETEYCFRGKAGGIRLADLAVFVKEDVDPLILIEIKYFDKPQLSNDTKPAQLEDYVAWKNGKRGDRNVMILSREMIIKKDIANRRWGELARHLRQDANNSDLIEMLCAYLEEEGVVMRNIDSKSLLGFFKRLLCGPSKSGVLANNLSGPAEFANFLTNMRLLSVPFDRHFKSAWYKAGAKIDDDYAKSSRIATIDYVVENRCSTTDAKKLFEDGDNLVLPAAKGGGRVTVFARYSLGHGRDEWLRVEYGFYFEIDAKCNQNTPPVSHLYTTVYGGALRGLKGDIPYFEKKIDFNSITMNAEKSTEKIEAMINGFLRNVFSSLLESKLKLNEQQKVAVKLLQESLETGNAN